MRTKKMEKTEKLVFKSKGISKKAQKIYFILAILLFVISIVGLAATAIIPSKVHLTGITKEGRIVGVGIFIGIMIMGAICLGLFVVGRRFFLKIYEDHLEGYSGFGFSAETINLPLSDIGELQSNIKGFMPSIIIYTKYDKKIIIIMDKNKVMKAEHILRSRWNYNFYKKEN